MSRQVKPQLFSLQVQSFGEFIKNGQADNALEMHLKLLKLETTIKPRSNMPVKLRWVHSPSIGIPREPFTVYRTTLLYNQVSSKSIPLIQNSISLSGEKNIEWGLKEMYYVVFNATLSTGQQLIIDAVDKQGTVIPFQRFVVTQSITGRFRSPGIAALRIRGTGILNSVKGISQNIIANDAQWQRVATVGLPYKQGEVPDDVYSNARQGVWVSNVSGLEAAHHRLEVERLLQSAMPSIPDTSIPTPIIPTSTASAYIDMLRNHELSPLSMITNCLQNSDNNNLSSLQADFTQNVTIPGLQQADSTPETAPEPITAEIQVVGTTMLSVGSDSFAATGLGYGMVDFIPPTAKKRDDPTDIPGMSETSIQYMTVGRFHVSTLNDVSHPAEAIEIAALSSTAPTPDVATNVTTERFQRLRPSAVDQPEQESIKLRWDLSKVHQGYLIGVSRQAGSFSLLNEKLLNNVGYKRIIPPRPARYEGDPPLDQEASYVDPLSSVPFSGTASQKYALIGQDVFGLWARWTVKKYTSQAPDIQIPALQSLSLNIDSAPLPSPLPDSTPVYSASLEIIFVWDWTDRSPRQIEFYGRFVAPTFSPPGTFSSKFQNVQSGGVMPASIVVSFIGASGTPSISSGLTTTIEVLNSTNQTSQGDTDERRYRLTAHNLKCSFASDNEITYAVRARGIENRRPTLRSDFTGTQLANGFDPGPPAQPTLAAELNWTALPDATNIARGVLEWDAIERTRGYIIWETTETTLRQLIDPDRPDPDQTISLQDRATEIRDMLATVGNDDDFRMRAFSRLNTDLIKFPKFELSLPGQADTIYAYQISAVGENNLESERDNSAVFFAVPRHIKPSQPSLILRELSEGAGIKILAIPGTGRPPLGYRAHRVRKSQLLPDIGTMGPPVYDETSPEWVEESVPTRLIGGNLTAQAIVDPVSESWYPYYYRVVALGEEDIDKGKLQGESDASISQVGFNPPSEQPTLIDPELSAEWRIERDYSVGRSPRGLAFHPRHKLLCVTNFNSNSVSLISTVSNRVITTIDAKSKPWGIAVNPKSDFIYVTNYKSGSVSIISLNLRRRRTQKTITGMSRPTGIVHSARHNRLFVADSGSRQIVVINRKTSRIEKRIKLGGTPFSLAIDTTRRSEKLFVADYSSGRIVQINTRTLLVEHSQFIGGRPFNIAIHSKARLAFVCDNTANTIVVLGLKTLNEQDRWTTSRRPIACHVDEKSNQLFVVSYTGKAIDVFDIVSGTLQQKVQLHSPLYNVTFIPSIQKLYTSKISSNQVVELKHQATSTDTHFVFTFQTNLPKRTTPLGNAWITLAEEHVDTTSANIIREEILRVKADAVTEGDAFDLLNSPTADDLMLMPEIRRVAHNSRVSQYSVRMQLPIHENVRIVLILTDPLNRVTESIIEENA